LEERVDAASICAPRPGGFAKAAASIAALWLLTHALFLSWGLPNLLSFGGDTVPPHGDLRAADHMRRNFYAYPPLQYLVYDAFFPKAEEPSGDAWKLCELRSAKLVKMRLIVAFMGLGSALAIAYGVHRACGSAGGAFAAGAMYLLCPEIVHRSLTTHMDQPYIFWWTLSLLCALLALLRSERGVAGRMLDLAAGLCLGFSAATKDQVYAAFVFPALAAFIALWRDCGWRRAFESAALWGFGSFAAWAGAWLWLGGGLEPLSTHLDVLTGKSSLDNVASGAAPGPLGMLKILLVDVWQLLRMLDWPLALLLAASCFAAFLAKQDSSAGDAPSRLRKRLAVSLCAALIAAISIEALFSQIVRLQQARYWLGLLPFLCFSGGLAAAALGRAPKTLKAALAALLVLQGALAFQSLLSMKFESRLALREELRRLEEADGARKGAVLVEGLAFRTFGGMTSLCDWSLGVTGLVSSRQVPSIISPSFLWLLDPDFVAVPMDGPSAAGYASLLRSFDYKLLSCVKPFPAPLPSLNGYSPPSFEIYGLGSATKVPEEAVKAELKAMDLNSQLLVLRHCARPEALERQLALAGEVLAPFDSYDTERYLIVPSGIAFAALAYEKAGRLDDAAKAHLFCLRHLGSEELLKRNALRFFETHPELKARLLAPQGSGVAGEAAK